MVDGHKYGSRFENWLKTGLIILDLNITGEPENAEQLQYNYRVCEAAHQSSQITQQSCCKWSYGFSVVLIVIFSSLWHHIFEFRASLFCSEICRRSSFCLAANWINPSEIPRGIMFVCTQLFLFQLKLSFDRHFRHVSTVVSISPVVFTHWNSLFILIVSRTLKSHSKLIGGPNKKSWVRAKAYPTPICLRFSLNLLRKKLERLQIDHITFQLTCWKKWTISGDQIRLAFHTLEWVPKRGDPTNQIEIV